MTPRGSRAAAALAAVFALVLVLPAARAAAQAPLTPPARDLRIRDMVDSISAARIEQDVRTLVGFGTRHTLSDTVSTTRGIGAARRWTYAEFQRISQGCGGCLDVEYQRYLVNGDPQGRIKQDTWVVSVTATLRGTTEPDHYVLMSGDIDSRVSDAMNDTATSPGANDNASGLAGTLEAARVLTKHRYDRTIVFAALSGEEQGLFGGTDLAKKGKDAGWNVDAVLNNDMIGNIQGIDGVIDNTSFRVFSQPRPVTDTERTTRALRFYGGEVDGPSRQLARYVARVADDYFAATLDPMMVYRLDRFGRGGHHRPFNDQGFPAVRIMETHENYNRQHQDVREENGIHYGDVIEGVDFDYARKLTGVNVAVLASLAWAPRQPQDVHIAGAVEPAARLSWNVSAADDLAGYKIYWRLTTAPQWTHWIYLPWDGEQEAMSHVMDGLVLDNYLFGVAAVDRDGHESVVAFPTPGT